jgi:hypothetical protein
MAGDAVGKLGVQSTRHADGHGTQREFIQKLG